MVGRLPPIRKGGTLWKASAIALSALADRMVLQVGADQRLNFFVWGGNNSPCICFGLLDLRGLRINGKKKRREDMR